MVLLWIFQYRVLRAALRVRHRTPSMTSLRPRGRFFYTLRIHWGPSGDTVGDDLRTLVFNTPEGFSYLRFQFGSLEIRINKFCGTIRILWYFLIKWCFLGDCLLNCTFLTNSRREEMPSLECHPKSESFNTGFINNFVVGKDLHFQFVQKECSIAFGKIFGCVINLDFSSWNLLFLISLH